MSHSIRQQLVRAQRFDIHDCANQIASLVAFKLFETPTNVVDSTYVYNGENIEALFENHDVVFGERLVGDFFDAFPEIEIEVKIEVSSQPDIDGYYYHTLDPHEEAGLIEVVVKLDKSFMNKSAESWVKKAIQSVLTHEMQHVVQRCYVGIDMAQVHNSPLDHLSDFREVDARVEEVLCDMEEASHSASHFKSKMISYIHEYCKRNNLVGVDVDQVVQNHTDFYTDKILAFV